MAPQQMRIRRILPLFYLGGLLLPFFWVVSSPSQVTGLDVQQSSVIQIKVSKPGGSEETAAGFYVGKDSTSAYFATAFHAVHKGDNAVVKNVTVHVKSSPQSISGSVLDKFDPELDLAVVIVLRNFFSGDASVIAIADPAPSGAIRILGHPPSGPWSVWSGTVQNASSENDPRRFTTTAGDSLTGGYSGGPVFNEEGFLVGMHVDNLRTYGRAVKAADIVRLLSSWRVPVNGFRSTDPAAAKLLGDPVKEACMNGSIVDCQNYSGHILVKCNPYDVVCKALATCWQDKARALQVVEFACKQNDESCEFQKENMRDTSKMDCDKKTLANY